MMARILTRVPVVRMLFHTVVFIGLTEVRYIALFVSGSVVEVVAGVVSCASIFSLVHRLPALWMLGVRGRVMPAMSVMPVMLVMPLMPVMLMMPAWAGRAEFAVGDVIATPRYTSILFVCAAGIHVVRPESKTHVAQEYERDG